MGHSVRRRLAGFVVRHLKIYNILRRLQPIATEISFGEDIRSRIDEIRELLSSLTLSQSSYIRLGDDFDGGYLLSNRIDAGTSCISVGAGTNISFDIAISSLVNEVHIYDHTIAKLPQIAPANVKYFPIGLGTKSLGKYLTLQECVSNFPPNSKLILKVDIEGAEWEIFDTETSVDFSRFSQIVIEFHDFYKINNEVHFRQVSRVLRKLNSTHQVINVHANNWGKFEIVANVPFADVLEVTYISRVMLGEVPSRSKIDELNKPCNPNAAEIELSF